MSEARLPNSHPGGWYDDEPITGQQLTALGESVESGELPSYSRFIVRKVLAEIERLGGELATLLEEKAAAFVDATTMFRGLNIRDGQAHLEIEPAREMILIWCASVRAMLDEHQAQNYIETDLEMPRQDSVSLDIQDGQNPTDSYTLTLQRRYGKTPHQLRLDAERERDELQERTEKAEAELQQRRAALQRVRHLIAHPYGAERHVPGYVNAADLLAAIEQEAGHA